MNEENILASLEPKWKDKYIIDWCHLCDVAIIVCPTCRNSSCNAGSCSECVDDFLEWHDSVHKYVEGYLTPDEVKAYHKALAVRRLLLRAIKAGETRIDFKKANGRGFLSRHDQELFHDKLV